MPFPSLVTLGGPETSAKTLKTWVSDNKCAILGQSAPRGDKSVCSMNQNQIRQLESISDSAEPAKPDQIHTESDFSLLGR